MKRLREGDRQADDPVDNVFVQVIVLVLHQCSESCTLPEWESVSKTCRELRHEVPAHLRMTTFDTSSISPQFLHACAHFRVLERTHTVQCTIRGINLSFSSSCDYRSWGGEKLEDEESLGDLKEPFSINLWQPHSVSLREAKLREDVIPQLRSAWALGIRPLWDRRITPRLMHMVWNLSIGGHQQINRHTSFLRLIFKYASTHPSLTSVSHYQDPVYDCSPMRRPRFVPATVEELKLLIQARAERYGPGEAPFRYNSMSDRLLGPTDFCCAICHEELFRKVNTFGICTWPDHHGTNAFVFHRPEPMTILTPGQHHPISAASISDGVQKKETVEFCPNQCHEEFGTPLVYEYRVRNEGENNIIYMDADHEWSMSRISLDVAMAYERESRYDDSMNGGET